jgi:DNA-binding MarR family transcriptional regulator
MASTRSKFGILGASKGGSHAPGSPAAMSRPSTNAGAASAAVPPATIGSTDAEGPGRFAYDGLERIFHEKARLGIMTSLVSHPEGLIFGDLKDLCQLTDGNLSRHLQVLHESGFVEIDKGYYKNRPQTLCRITLDGRRRFLEYISVLESVVQDALQAARSAAESSSSVGKAGLTDGLSPA